MRCIKCNGTEFDLVDQTFKNGMVHKARICKVCGKHNQWASFSKPEDWVMPFGKFKGETLKAILEKDRGYLVWLKNEKVLKAGASEKLDLLLRDTEAPSMEP